MDSARHEMSYIAEVTYGTTPAVTPAFQKLRHTGTTLALAKGTMISEEIRSDRNVPDLKHGTRQTGGEIQGEMSYTTYDDLIQAAMGGTWTAKAAPCAAATISAAAADNSINDSANGLPLLDVGDHVTIAGFTGGSTTANQANLIVVSSTAAKMVLSGGVAFINDAAGESVTVTTLTQTLKVGSTRRSFTLLRNFTDETTGGDNPYHIYPGQEMNSLQLAVGVEKIISIVLGLLGQTQGTPSDTAPAGATFVAPTTTKVMDAFTGTIFEGGSAIATITELTVSVENGLTPKFTVCTDLTRKPSVNRSNITGQITAYAENATLLKKFINQTESSIKLFIQDSAGNGIRLNFPRIKYTGGQMDVKGQGPITIPLPFQALYDATALTSFSIDRIAA